MVAQVRPFARPAADTDVGVVALGEDPAVPAARRAELHDGGARRSARGRAAPRRRCPRARRRGRCPRRALPPSRRRRSRRRRRRAPKPRPARRRPSPVTLVVPELDVRDTCAVAEGRACGGRLLGEVRVEPTALRHQDQRLVARAAEVPPVVEPQLERVDDVLDDRVDRARRLAQRAAGDAAAARLVAREASPGRRGAPARRRGRGGSRWPILPARRRRSGRRSARSRSRRRQPAGAPVGDGAAQQHAHARAGRSSGCGPVILISTEASSFE